MSDYRSLIDRVAEPATPPPNAFERLVRRRTHRQWNRRIGTAVLAVTVAAAGISGAFLAFGRPTNRLSPVTTPKSAEVAPLWPQYSGDEARHAQERADAGDPDFTWLLDPSLVAYRFASTYLGWKEVSAVSIAAGISSRVSITICASREPCSRSAFTQSEPQATVSLSRLGQKGIGGVWNVTGVRDPTIPIWGPDGQRLKEDASLGADDPLAAVVGGGDFGVGTLTHGPCGFLLRSRQVTLEQSLAYFGVDADMGTCLASRSVGAAPGYILVYTPARAQLRSEGRHLEPIRLTAVQVSFAPSTQPQPIPTPAEYSIDLPDAPGSLDAEALTILDARTNLPENTWVWLTFQGPDWATEPHVQVLGGRIQIRVANDRCQKKDGKLIGSRVTVVARVTASGVGFRSCGIYAGYCGNPQAPSAIQILGRHFEFVRGPQLHDGILEASRLYQLPDETCR